MNFRFCRKVTLFGLLVIGMAACIVPSALAQEGFAAYSHLPPSYSSIKVFDSKGQFVADCCRRKDTGSPSIASRRSCRRRLSL